MTGVLQSLEKKTRPSTSAITVVSQEVYGCMNDRAASWLEGRGIDPELASRIGIVSVTQRDGSEWIAFPYVKNGEVINRKYRSLDRKDFRMDPGRPQVWFNGDVITDASLSAYPLIITEGECLPGETEVLTPEGWVAIADYHGGMVAQWSDGRLHWVVPLAKVDKPYVGDLIHFRGRSVTMAVTPGHRMAGIGKGGDVAVLTAEERADGYCRHHVLPRSGVLDGPGTGLSSDQIAFCIAVSADAAIDVRKQSYAGGPARRPAAESRYARMWFRRERKIDRLAGILSRLGLPFSRTQQRGGEFFGVPLPQWVPGRLLPWEWVAVATSAERDFILHELREWDGNGVPGRSQEEFATKHVELAEWVQAMCHTSGRCSTIMQRENGIGSWYKVSVLHGKSSGSYQSMRVGRTHHSGRVYCLTVPSGFFLVRQEGRVFVTGNCDAIVAIQCGFIRSVSVPGGAPSTVGSEGNAKYAFIADTLDDLRGTREVILAVDGDKPGMNLMHDISIRIGRGRCKYVTYPDGCKDLNDVYRDYGSAGVSDVLNNSRWCHVPGLFMMSELPPVPFVKPYDTLIHGLSEHYRIRKCDFTVVTGVPGSGKSTFVNDIASRMAWNHGWRTCFASFEQHPQIDHRRALRTWHSKKLEKYMASDEIAAADKWIDQFFSFVVQEEDADADLEWLLDKLASAVIRFGADICVIDPWNEMDHALPNGQSQTDYIGYAIRQLKKFARKWNVHVIVVAHPAKLLRDKEGKMPIPSLYDINGSANWANKCDVGIIVHNCSTDEDGEYTIIRVAKTRYRDQIGVPGDVPVRFDRDTSRFVAL